MSEFVQDVAKAAKALRGLFNETPLQRNNFLSQKYDAEIYLKREDLTPVRSYKIRGAFNFISQMLDKVAPEAAFVCASAGNHAQGLAFVCRHFKRKGVIFMPITTPQQKIDKTRSFGGEYTEIPVGGGGLASGVSHFIKESGWDSHVRFAEPEGAASLFKSLTEQKRIKLEEVDTFVDGAAVAQIGELNFDMLKRFSPFDVSIVPENRLCATMVEMLNVEGIVLEPAGGLSVDALKSISPQDLKGKKVLLIISGGNFDFERLPDVKERALRYQGLKKYFIFRFPPF